MCVHLVRGALSVHSNNSPSFYLWSVPSVSASLILTTLATLDVGKHTLLTFVTGFHLQGMISSRFIHVVVCVRVSFLLSLDYVALCVCLHVYMYMDCLYLLAFVHNAAVIVDVQVSV